MSKKKNSLFYETFKDGIEAEKAIRDHPVELLKLIKHQVKNDENLVQEIYVHILEKAIQKYDGRTTLGKYINGVIWRRRTFGYFAMGKETYRKGKLEAWATNPKNYSPIYYEKFNIDDVDLFDHLAKDLSSRDREVVKLRFLENHDYKTIASFMQMTVLGVTGVVNDFVDTVKKEYLNELQG